MRNKRFNTQLWWQNSILGSIVPLVMFIKRNQTCSINSHDHIIILFESPHDFCDFDISCRQAPQKVPNDIALLVGSDGVSGVDFYFHFAVKRFHINHQLPVFHETVTKNKTADMVTFHQVALFFKKKFPPVLIRKDPMSQPILPFDNTKFLCILYELDKKRGYLSMQAFLEIFPIIYWLHVTVLLYLPQFFIIKRLNHHVGGLDLISARQLVQLV